MGSDAVQKGNAGTSRPPIEIALLVLELLVGVMALICGPLLIVTDGLGMDRSELEGTPFDSFVIPGLVLSLGVGVSLIVAAAALWKRSGRALLVSLGAGCVLLGWIVVEIVMIDAGRGLQAIILGCALAILGGSAILLRSPRRQTRSAHRR